MTDQTQGQGQDMSDSRFHMWRAIFAMAHADSVVTNEERAFMYKILTEEPLSAIQRAQLERDISAPQSIPDMFAKITDPDDRSQFFYFARMLVWTDGDFGAQEQKILLELNKAHVKMTDMDSFTGDMAFELDEEDKMNILFDHTAVEEGAQGGLLGAFYRRFRKK
ncbi:tellurite resistance TerB family protein [Micavibrio aeruginosavorus]|uniref:Co-chaperone DjlA N-terminal domain-containing protein n=1 Tax=Micavibrio aeruginosavorus EPB TaxID=349215 RepID=M4VGJ3_9BACT|nr:DUF533 domain-containing protein [Micavibrio aeruginosavorus]AGH97595.1 hypothetical protein A11S_772 [Micavibrio aeruginosavorus EPB]